MKHEGNVAWFDIEKGFGFLESESFENRIFVHFSAIETKGFKYLNAGDQVQFKVIEGSNGWQVSKVKKLDVLV